MAGIRYFFTFEPGGRGIAAAYFDVHESTLQQKSLHFIESFLQQQLTYPAFIFLFEHRDDITATNLQYIET